jgi:type I restriction enzyme M protein
MSDKLLNDIESKNKQKAMNSSSLKTNNSSLRTGYSKLTIHHSQLNTFIFSHPEFIAFSKDMDNLFADWKKRNTVFLKALTVGIKPKQTIHNISEDALQTYTGKALMDKYDVYQHIMNYWNEVMQDDCYLIAVDGWKAEPQRIIVKNKAGKETDKGWDCDLVPKYLVIDRYFAVEAQFIATLEAEKETINTQLAELEEEHSAEDGYFSDYDKINRAKISYELKVISDKLKKAKLTPEETTYNSSLITVLKVYLNLTDELAELNKKIRDASNELDTKALAKYGSMQLKGIVPISETEIKQLVVDDKWMASLERSVKTEMERISQRLTQRIKELAERYETPLPRQTNEVKLLEDKVNKHLEIMGFKMGAL